MDFSFRFIRNAVIAVIFIAVSGASLLSIAVIYKNTSVIQDVLYFNQDRIGSWVEMATDMGRVKQLFLEYVEGTSETFSPVDLTLMRIKNRIQDIKEQGLSVHEADHIREIEKKIRTFRQAAYAYRSEVAEGYRDGASAWQVKRISIIEAEQMQHTMMVAYSEVSKEIRDSFDKIIKRGRVFSLTVAVFLVISLASVVVMIIILSLELSRRLNLMVQATERVSRGDLLAEVNIDKEGDFALLGQAFNRMIEDLRKARSAMVDKRYVNSIVENMADALIVVNLEGNVTMANQATLDLLEYSLEEVRGQSIDKFLVEEEAEILNEIEAGAMLVGRDFKMVSVNEYLCKMMGASKDGVKGQYCYKFTHQRDTICEPPHDICPIKDIFLDGSPRVETHTHFDKAHNPVLVNVVAAPILDSDGELLYYLHLALKVREGMTPEEAHKGDIETTEKIIEKLKTYVARLEKSHIFKGKGLKRVLEMGHVKDAELRFLTKSGAKVPVSFSGAVLTRGWDEVQGRDDKMPVGVIGVARDMRQVNTLIAQLKDAKTNITEWSKTLERKVLERTQDMAEAQEATLNIMEDLEAERGKLEKINEALVTAKKEIEDFSKVLEGKVEERTKDLAVLYEVSNAISYTMDFQQLFGLILGALKKVLKYDIGAAIFFDERAASVVIRSAFTESGKFVDSVKNSIIETCAALTGENIRRKRVNTFILPFEGDEVTGSQEEVDMMRSFYSAPLMVRGEIKGELGIWSGAENAFSKDSQKLVSTMANQAATAIERLKTVISAEKTKMESMVQSMDEGVIMLDERNEVSILNPKAREFLDLGPEGAVSHKELGEKLSYIDLDQAIRECRVEKKTIVRDVVVFREKERILSCYVSPVRDFDGKTIGIVTVLRDITKEREADKAKSEFITTVSHELRTPLTSIREGVSQVLEGILGDTTADQREFLAICLEDIDRLQRIINGLLDISKIEAGKMTLKRDLVDMREVVREIISVFTMPVKNKGLTLKTEIQDKEMKVFVDRDKILQVFTNLMGNSMKFTEAGSIEIGVEDKDEFIECYVKDTGCGISKDDQKKVFSKFEQFGRMPGAGEKGTGLGLSIAKGIVEMHNGKIWVESEPEKGTKFTFHILKHGLESVLINSVENKLAEAKKEHAGFLLLDLKITNYKELVERLSKEKAEEIYYKIFEAVENAVRSNDITTISGFDEIVVLANGTKDKAEHLVKRVLGIAKAVVFDFEEDREAEFSYGCTSFPEDSIKAGELLAKARKGMVAERELRHSKVIMIADDDEIMVESLKEMLTNEGYKRFITANDGEETVTKALSTLPDLMIIDIQMPKMSGYEVIGRIKEDARTKAIPIIITSAYAVEKDELREYTNKEKTIPTIAKPFNAKVLEKWIKYFL